MIIYLWQFRKCSRYFKNWTQHNKFETEHRSDTSKYHYFIIGRNTDFLSIDSSHKSHNASGMHSRMHHMCTYPLQNGTLWDMGLANCGICTTGHLRITFSDVYISIELFRSIKWMYFSRIQCVKCFWELHRILLFCYSGHNIASLNKMPHYKDTRLFCVSFFVISVLIMPVWLTLRDISYRTTAKHTKT